MDPDGNELTIGAALGFSFFVLATYYTFLNYYQNPEVQETNRQLAKSASLGIETAKEKIKNVFGKSKNKNPADEQSPLPSKGHLEGKDKGNKGQVVEPPGNYPGDDPTKAPDGYEWRGKVGSQPGSKDGGYYNPDTGESLRPDLDHPDGVSPHWDYKDHAENHWRWFPGD